MSSDRISSCFERHNQHPSDFKPAHEILNCVACVILIICIAANSVLRNAYKFDLLPVLLITAVYEYSYVCYSSIPGLVCYFLPGMDKPWNLQFARFFMYLSGNLKPVFIMHCLIRIALNVRYSSIGVFKTIILPAVLFVILIVVESSDESLLDWAAEIVWSVTALTNIGLSIYLIRKGQIGGFSFPIIMLAHGILHYIPEILKLSMRVARYHSRHELIMRSYLFIDDYDEYANYLMAVFILAILVWDYRKYSAQSRIDDKAYDGHDCSNIELKMGSSL